MTVSFFIEIIIYDKHKKTKSFSLTKNRRRINFYYAIHLVLFVGLVVTIFYVGLNQQITIAGSEELTVIVYNFVIFYGIFADKANNLLNIEIKEFDKQYSQSVLE